MHRDPNLSVLTTQCGICQKCLKTFENMFYYNYKHSKMNIRRGKKDLIIYFATFAIVGWLTGILLFYNGHKKFSPKVMKPIETQSSREVFQPESAQRLETLSSKILSKPQPSNELQHNISKRPGDMGSPVILPSKVPEDIQKLIDEGYAKNAFNQYVSDLISVRRNLPDFQDPWCKEDGRFLNIDELSPTSVIICFHNEAWSVLLRTIHSILDRSPESLIEEIILVDDFSHMPYSKTQLEDYWAHEPKVKIIRATKREGLIRARLLGASSASGKILTFLDSHCECTPGWLQPLLDRIERNPTAVVCPVIDSIDDNDLEYRFINETNTYVGIFDWSLIFDWQPETEREKKRRSHYSEPIRTPTMAGGLFSINKAFFEKLGRYDDGFDIWGGENMELSLKTWMCGGVLEIVPCSHVGHIYRKWSPYKLPEGNIVDRNNIRLAKVWMDEYAEFFFDRFGGNLIPYGDISKRKALRDSLDCKSFRWFLDNIVPELPIPLASGSIRNLGYGGKTCLDGRTERDHYLKPVGLWPCHDLGGNQYWVYTKTGEIRRDHACLDYNNGDDIVIYPCHGSQGNQYWEYKDLQLIHPVRVNSCLAINSYRDKLIMEECNIHSMEQMWILEKFNRSRV